MPDLEGKSESKVIGPRFKFTPRFHRPHTSGNLPKVRYRQFKGGRWWQTYKDIRVASFIHNILLELFQSTSLVSIGIKLGMTGQPQTRILGIFQSSKYTLFRIYMLLPKSILGTMQSSYIAKGTRDPSRHIEYFDSTTLFRSRRFNNLWNFGQTSTWFCLAKGNNKFNVSRYRLRGFKLSKIQKHSWVTEWLMNWRDTAGKNI